MSKRTIGILGLGIFGSSIVETLKNYECDIIAVDNQEGHINALTQHLTQGVVGDITDFELLQAAGIDTCDAVVIATGSSLEASVLAIMHCKNLGVEAVVAKATTTTTAEVLLKIGADEVITPEKEMGIAVAKQVLFPNTTDVIPIDQYLSLVEFFAPEAWLGRKLIDVPLRQKYQINLVGFRVAESSRINTKITADYIFKADERLVAITDNQTFDRFDGLSRLT
ncbi:TrkA family potassium uptake protein [Streptococcus merionis]|uniref:potassium channel family protein n=1 Tax=Streptococcus merionis TaxID=400065 RepID=UPI0026E9468D|nr:TrkA family potassium uptake protein [Streptococcus merionis]